MSVCLVDPWHRERVRRAFDYVVRNLDMLATLAALVLLAVCERLTAANPPL